MDTEYETGNMGHRPRTKGGYFPVPPVDSARTCAPKCCRRHGEMGVTVEKAPPRSGAAQHELAWFDT
jgi:glutamine synthetase